MLAAALDAAQAAGQLICRMWRQPREVRSKGFRDVVTDADIAAQKLITDMIQARFPDHGFLTEEDDGRLPADGPIIWVIDPVDGTTNYSRDIPTFCVSIAAVTAAHEVIVGVVYDPLRDEMFSAARGQGAWLNGPSGRRRAIRVSQVDDLSAAIFGLDWSREPELRQAALAALDYYAHRVNDIRAIGAAALALSWVAAGRVDAYLNFQLSPWDLAAASLLIHEAGGELLDLEGRPWTFTTYAGGCLAGNGRIPLIRDVKRDA